MSFGDLALDVGRKKGSADRPESVVDVITFIESPWGLNMRLFPVQRVILKAHYGMDLDDNPHGFDLEKPIPQDHPLYSEMIDLDPIPAVNAIEIRELEDIPKGAEIRLTSPEGKVYQIVEGRHWHNKGDEQQVLESIEQAINKVAGDDFEADALFVMNQVEIRSKAFSSYGNDALLELTNCPGFMVAFPPLEIYQYEYQTFAHKFYGGEGGFYKYRVPIRDWKGQNPRVFTEAGYLKFLYDDGRCNIREVIPGQQRREMVLSIGRRSGKCVAGDTLIFTDQGVLPIQELGDPDGPEIQPLNIGVAQEGPGARARSSHFYNGGVRDTFRVVTRCGFKIEGTGNHRVRVMGSEGTIRWAYLDEIGEGDHVCIHRGADLWSEGPVDLTPYHNTEGRKEVAFPDVLTPDWGYLLGILVGDGCWTLPNRVEVTVGDAEYRELVVSVFDRLLGDTKYKPDLRREATGQVQSNSIAWRKFLHDLGWTLGCGSQEKRVPWAIMRSPRKVVTSFLRGLFDADGGVENSGKVVSFCSASEQLAREVQLLLLNLGVVARVRSRWDAKYQRDYYILTVRGLRSRQVFADQVGFTLTRKMEPLRTSLESASREGGDVESIPHLRPWASKLLQTVPRNKPGQGWGRSYLRAVLGNTVKPSASDEMTGHRLAEALRVAQELGAGTAEVEHLQGILEADYFYDPVVSVEESEARVYDLTVPEGHMFVANGMTNHNTLITSCIVAYETYCLLKKGNPQKFYGSSQSNVIQLISIATDKDQAGLLYQEASGHFRGCFAPETRILTGEGTKAIGDLVGQEPEILTRNGTWKKAPIHSFGVQRLYAVRLRRQGVEKTIYATKEHRWFAQDHRKAYRGQGYREFTTEELRPGKHRLQSTFGRSYKNRIHASPFGVAHGFAFGDGSTTAGKRNATLANLYGEKDKALLPYFSMCPQRAGDVREGRVSSVEVGALPNLFRKLPDLQENKAYLLGWLQGYFAADGCVSKGQVSFSSAVRENLEFVRDVCTLLGIGTYGIRTEDRVVFGKPARLFRIRLMRQGLDESFFLIPAHREAFLAAGGSDVCRDDTRWKVVSVEPTDRVEEVFCASVPENRDFVLEDNIATGNCDYFAPYMANSTQSFANFQTPFDIDKYGAYTENPKAKYSVKVTFRSCVAKGLRGGANIVVALDEVAHFGDAGQSSAEEVYQAVEPSTRTFSPKDPNNPTRPVSANEGRIIMISSPLGKQGLFYKSFLLGFKNNSAARNMLCIQAPTWEVNPTVPSGTFEASYFKDPRVFATEFGAEFTDRTRGWINEAKDLLACVDPNLKPKKRGPIRAPHFMGLDVALVGDYSAVAIGHLDEQGNVILDYVERIRAGEGKYENQERLEFDDVADWVEDLSKRFYIARGMFDQWAGIPMEQALVKKGLKQMESVHHTRQLTSQMFQNFKDMMYDKRLVLYNWPPPEKEGQMYCDYIEELLGLQEEIVSKYITLVEAPKGGDRHDDFADAIVRMVWLATTHAGKVKTFGKNVKTVSTGKVGKSFGLSPEALQARQRAKLGGSHESRQVKKRRGGGGGGVGGSPIRNMWGR